ncbi:MAG TPA: Dyp-type peroxidase [Myxococcota bacterium]|jgi:putative iron-dependent peroxidase
MAKPQAVILPTPGPSALFLVLRVPELARDGAEVVRIAARTPALAQAVARLDPKAKLASGIAFGSALWDVASPVARPRGLHPFRLVAAEDRRAPATPGDLLLHVTSKRPDLNFELALRVRAALGARVEVVEEVHGFQYLDIRDLTGFIDGTQNPKGVRGRSEAALIGREDPAFAGGSYVFTQRYVHDLARWNALPLAEQESAVGRRKRDSKEMSDKAKPPSAHISRVVIVESGAELEIVRHSLPYGTTSEAGLFFLAYTRDLVIPERMLERMLGASGDGIHDRLMEFTHAVSGAAFFAPSETALRRLAAG